MTQDAQAPALYLRCATRADLDVAVGSGAAGIALEARLDDTGAIAVADALLDPLLDRAREHGLAVELIAGRPLDPTPSTSLVARLVAELVSGQRDLDTISLSSFDHDAVSRIGSSVEGLAVGLRHIVTLHRGELYARRARAAALHPSAGAVDSSEVGCARDAGIRMHAWTLVADFWPVDERTQLAQAMAAGVDAVTISDPRLLVGAGAS